MLRAVLVGEKSSNNANDSKSHMELVLSKR